MTDEQHKVTRSFRLFSEKPRRGDLQHGRRRAQPERFTVARLRPSARAGRARRPGTGTGQDERRRTGPNFEREMGVGGADRDDLIRTLLKTSGQRLFLTAGEKEVRTWLLPQGGTALDAAAAIHTDLARGFIRAEVMTCSDLVRLGSERELKAQHLVRQEPKDYVIQDDDILFIRFSV